MGIVYLEFYLKPTFKVLELISYLAHKTWWLLNVIYQAKRIAQTLSHTCIQKIKLIYKPDNLW